MFYSFLLWHRRRKKIHSVLLGNVIFRGGGRQLWPPFSQPFFSKMGMFLCSLDWKFPKFSKTHPTFVCSPFLGGAMGNKRQITLFFGTPCTCISIRQVLINLFTAHSCFSSNNSENLNRTPWSSECLGWADWDGRRDCQESSSNESRSWRGISTSRSTMSARSRCSLTASINPLRNSSARLV